MRNLSNLFASYILFVFDCLIAGLQVMKFVGKSISHKNESISHEKNNFNTIKSTKRNILRW